MILAVDTAGTAISLSLVAASCDGSESGEWHLLETEGRAHHISKLVQRLLDEACKRVETIDALVVGLGPGSFTGVRIGVGYMSGLAAALGKPLGGASSLAGRAVTAPVDSLITVIEEAHRGEVFASFFRVTESGPVPVAEHRIVARGRIAAVADEVFGGAPSSMLSEEVLQGASSTAAGLARLCAIGSTLMRYGSEVTPLYVRPLQAQTLEERLAKR